MAGSRKVTTQKKTALSKQHKPGKSSNKKKKSNSARPRPAPHGESKNDQDDLPSSTGRSFGKPSSFPLDKPSNSSAKKDRKGKGPALIPVVTNKDFGSDGEEEDDNDKDGLGMDVDEELEDFSAEFLTRLDEKGMAASRARLVELHRKEKPAPAPRVKTSLLSKIPLPEPKLLKSEIKAQKKKEKTLKKQRLKGKIDEDANGSLAIVEDQEDDENSAKKKRKGADGELIDDLESDDLAFGSGSSDDDLSTISEMESLSEMSDISEDEETDVDDEKVEEDEEDDDEDDEENEGEDKDEDDDEDEDEEEESLLEGVNGGVVTFDSEEELNYGDSQDDSDISDESEEDISGTQSSVSSSSTLDEEVPKRKKKKVISPEEADELETAYESSRKPTKTIKSKPTKLPVIANGKVIRQAREEEEDQANSAELMFSPEPEVIPSGPEYRSDPLGQRFGRPAIRQLLEIKDKKARLAKAREEIADLGREASGTGEGEGGLNLLKRLLSLCAPKFSSSLAGKSAGGRPIAVDREVRAMAMISLLAVLIDIVPGYRIRPLTPAEKEVKVSQMVARQREWEDGLVGVYKRFLELCEVEISEETPLQPAAIHCLCTLVHQKPDFNFAVNIMDVVVKRVGRKGWDDGHQMCLTTISQLFADDTSTTASNSLHLVRLISRLVRARSFAIRPEVLTCLLNLRLKDELGGGRVRASTDSVYREKDGKKGIVRWNKEKDRKGRKGGRAKEAMSKTGSKKARAARKEKNAIDKEMREAEGEINVQERERNMTETLKLLFALYFRVVKLDYRSPLLPAALEGLARFAHLVNIDFFRDLLEVLKGIIGRGDTPGLDDELSDSFARRNDTRERLLCIVTAFELLQGQGEALNVDLGDFVSALYALILPLALSPTFEEVPYLGRNMVTSQNRATAKLAQTEADLLFRALAAIFLTPRSLPPVVRTLAFSKRLMTASLQWPTASQLRTLAFLRSLLIREPKLEAMLETSDRKIDGKWKGWVDEPERSEPEGTCWWEGGLYRCHPDEKVRLEAKKLLNWVRE